jgi:Protein of unknown function (DUF2490).
MVCMISIVQGTLAQKNIMYDRQVWLGYNSQSRFSDKWGVWLDGNLRTRQDFFTNFYQAVARVGIMYNLNEATRVTAGYAFINYFPDEGHKAVSQFEHRPWQQLHWQTVYNKKILAHRIRLEERYRRKVLNDSTLADGYNFNFRARYNLGFQVPLSKKGIAPNTFSFVVNDEVMVNFGKEIVYNYFDQNRIFLGFAYHPNANDQLQIGYMNVFQQLSAGNRYRNSHVVRVFFFHNLDLRKGS